jgi:hypothetical protein
MAQGRMEDPKAILSFMIAGKATVTLVSLKTSDRFTYKVRLAPKAKPTDADCWFVSLLNGPDNYLNYAYIGIIRRGDDGKLFFKWTSKSRVGEAALSVRGFKWAIVYFADGRMPKNLEVWHEGKCGRCGRKLTVPESISSGFGPECVGKVGFASPVGLEEEQDNAEEQGLQFDPQTYLGGTPIPVGNGRGVMMFGRPATGRTVNSKAIKSLGGRGVAAALYAPAVPQKEHSVEVAIQARIDRYRVEEPENYWQDGELRTKEEADAAAYKRFAGGRQ